MMNLGILALIVMSIFWGTGFAFAKELVNLKITPLNIIFYRFGISSLIMLILFFPKIIKTNLKEILISSSTGISMIISYITLNYGLNFTTASKAGFVSSLYVIMVPFINLIFLKERLNKQSLTAALLAIIGLALLTLNNNFSSNFGFGEILNLIGAFTIGIQIVIISKYGKNINPFALVFYQTLTMAILAFIWVLITGEATIHIKVEAWKYLSLLAILVTVIPLLLQAWALKRVNSKLAAIIISFESMFGAIFSFFLLGEKMTFYMILGAIILIGAMFLSQLEDSKNN